LYKPPDKTAIACKMKPPAESGQQEGTEFLGLSSGCLDI